MQLSREQVCELTSRKLTEAAAILHERRALIGLDGFVDEIIAVVDKRHANGSYDSVKTIDRLGQKIAGATGQSSNYELVVKQMKLGGNGPLMANALASAGLSVTYVGRWGIPTFTRCSRSSRRKWRTSSASPSRRTPTRWSSRTGS